LYDSETETETETEMSENPVTDSQMDEEWARFPRSKRGRLYMAIMNNPSNTVFRDGPDDTHVGRWFATAMGDYTAPISSLNITEIIDILFHNLPANKESMKPMFRNMVHRHMVLLNTVAPV
jgi:hypothetical protein